MKINFLIFCAFSLLIIACSNASHPIFRDIVNIDSVQTFDILQKKSMMPYEKRVLFKEFNAVVEKDNLKVKGSYEDIFLIGKKSRLNKSSLLFVRSTFTIYCYSLVEDEFVDKLIISQVGDPHLHQIAEFTDIDTILITEEHECQTNEITYNINTSGNFVKLNERVVEVRNCDDDYGP